jgi:HlyD family secretion protein
LIAEVFITNQDIGFVKEGMTVDVRIDSFPFSEYGDIQGEIISIGSDALPPDQIYDFYRFPAKIKLDSQTLNTNGREIPLQSGMSVSTNIKLREDRRVISLFLERFTKEVESLKNVR